MPADTDHRSAIAAVLGEFQARPVAQAARSLLAELGYTSDRTIHLSNSSPQAFREFIRANGPDVPFSEAKALYSDWRSADLLFQLTDEELSGNRSLFQETAVNPGLLRSYLFFAIELTGDNYARGQLTGIARQINRVFPMPVMVLIKHLAEKRPVLSIALINRRQNKRDAAKDVLGKVTIIRDISLAEPHRGHLDILDSFAVPNLVHPKRLPIDNFDSLHSAWEEIFNVELLNRRFYRELANWYFWALPQVEFPNDIEKDAERRRATSLIRMLTRLIFCWFLKEKGLIPENLFVEAELAKILKDLDPNGCAYHQAVLQNLFFATLNQRMGKDKNGQPYRGFARDEGLEKNRSTYGVDTLYRYEEHFRDPTTALDNFADVPFLNGGLFECLDRTDEATGKKLYLDGFSRNEKKRPSVPNRLFFAGEQTADLSDAYGEPRRRTERVRGLLRILHSYKFTIVENTPIDQEIALDPELLGQVFENLLASYNEETKTTARKQTGSFYTPRPIVEYMVDESLKAHLAGALVTVGMSGEEARAGLNILFAYTEREHAFSEREAAALLDAIHTCKILDPACGSGAFPMGMLQKLVYIIHKLDPDNARWMQLQIDAAAKIPDSSARDAAIAAIERDFADNEDDFGRKLYLIENCLYGVDIQPIAIQISKLRFFISLICDQRTSRTKKENHGIRPLPNLETKFVAADTLIGLPEAEQLALAPRRVSQIEAEIESLYHRYFAIQRRDQKLAIQRKTRDLRQELGKVLAGSLMAPKKAQHVADWNPFDPQASSDFFDPHWMFGRSLEEGFDIVVGNPPYVFGGNTGISAKDKDLYRKLYVSGSGKTNLFVIFIERGIQLLKQGGFLSYIIPNTLLRVTSYYSTRKLILNKACIDEIIDLDVGVFNQVTASTIVIRLRNQTPESNRNTIIRHGLDDDRPKQFRQLSWNAKGNIIDIFSSQRDREILDQLAVGTVPLGDLCLRIRFGVVVSGNLSEVVSDRKHGSAWKPFLEGDEIAPYAINYRGRFLHYDSSLLHRSRTPDVFETRKIVIQRITGGQTPLKAALDEQEFYNKESILNLILSQRYVAMYGFILALLNSKTANWFYRKRFTNASKLTVNLSKEYVGQIPVPIPRDVEVATFDKLIYLLMLAKRSNALAPVQFLIDLTEACVMECYFREHMAELNLLFLDDLAPHLVAYNPEASEAKQLDFLAGLHRTLDAPSSKIRNRLIRLTADSPDLLAVIKAEGKV
ncbi:N-6 DNA methylase [Mesorhizobium sp. M0991]|uniref:Eco57I restriction-modification methylase domain-containing protein n=1 Tax=Mesorhizobium sp. M0991 TaxID=2957043 RepID=UPI00333CEFB6